MLSKRNTEIAALNGRHFRRQEPGHPGRDFSASRSGNAANCSSAIPATVTGVESSVIATAISSSAAATGTASAQSPTYSTIQNVSALSILTGNGFG